METINLFLDKFYKDFQEYTYKNQVLIAASGFAIGIATVDLLKSILNDNINPLIVNLFKNLLAISPVAKKYPTIFHYLSNLTSILWLFIVWILTIFLSFFVIEYLLNRKIIGLSSSIPIEEKKDFIKEKIASKQKNNIIPNENDKKEIEIEKELIENY